jgi:hypothetical protein
MDYIHRAESFAEENLRRNLRLIQSMYVPGRGNRLAGDVTCVKDTLGMSNVPYYSLLSAPFNTTIFTLDIPTFAISRVHIHWPSNTRDWLV